MALLIRSSILRNIQSASRTSPFTFAQRNSVIGGQQCCRNSTTFSQRYTHLLTTRPLLVQGVQAGVLSGVGDLIAQVFVEKKSANQIDFIRTLRFFSLGAIFVGPMARAWYGLLDRRLKHKNPTVRTFQKMFFDQFVFAPIFLAQIVSLLSFMQHQSLPKVEQKLRREYTDILVANYYVWPWVQLVNFGFVPLNYQVPLTQLVAVMWNIYISWKTNKDE